MPDLWSTTGPPSLAVPGGILWRGSSKLVSPIGIADNLTLKRDSLRTPSDSIGIAGAQTFAQGFNRTASDPLGLNDTLSTNLVHQSTFGALGTGLVTTSTSGSWSHVVGANDKALLVGMQVSATTTPNPTVTAGGVTMTQLIGFTYYASLNNYLFIYGLLNPPTGTITIAASGMVSNNNTNSASYAGVSSFGTPASSNSTSSTCSHAVSGGVSNGMLFQVLGAAGGTSAFSGYNQTQRWNQWTNGTSYPMVIGDAVGASATFNATVPAGTFHEWGSVVVPLIP